MKHGNDCEILRTILEYLKIIFMVHNIHETFSKLLKTIFVVCKDKQTILVSHKIRNHCF